MSNNTHKKLSLAGLPMDIARLVCAPLTLIFRVKSILPSGERVKNRVSGGAIIAANHTSFADPFIIGVTFWYRRMYLLVAEVVMKGRLRSFLLRGVGAIKVDRYIADIEAVKKSVEVLKKGYLLTVFPEGKINEGEQSTQLKSGVVLMALQASVPIIPVYIRKTPHWYSRKTVVFGNPINPAEHIKKRVPSNADITAVTELLAAELRRIG